MRVWTIVVGAGSGSRFGAPKQLADLGGRRVLDWSLDAARATSDGVVVVLPGELAQAEGGVVGGATRSESVRNGLAAVPDEADVIIVHDAARPLASTALFHAVIEAVVAGADAAIPALPVTDTLKRVEGDLVDETVDRAGLVAVQTPQAFRAAALRAAHAGGVDASDDAALVEATGGKVVVVPGDPRNRKITTPDDLRIATALLDVGSPP